MWVRPVARVVIAKHSRVGALACLLIVCAPPTPAANFSQYPGFQAWRERERAAARVPSPGERALLERHRPRFMLPEGHPGLIDFYRDYVAGSTLRTARGGPAPGPVDRAGLNRHADDPEAVLEHRAPRIPALRGTVYGRADPVRLRAAGRTRRLTVLSWHAVFRASGLPAGLSGPVGWVAGLVADPHDWHQLDHYTAASLVLDSRLRPVALMLQQHNYTRTYLLGESLELPADGRPRLDVAVRSNELYPHRAGAHWRRAVRFADANGVRYLMGFAGEPLMAARDLTDGVREADYGLEFLSTDDAFYLFQGYLGERRTLPGRDGPPGATYNTVPGLKPLSVQLFAGYWREGSAADRERFERLAVAGGSMADFAAAQRRVFFTNLDCLRRERRTCG
jgi:hypothetical protein